MNNLLALFPSALLVYAFALSYCGYIWLGLLVTGFSFLGWVILIGLNHQAKMADKKNNPN